MTSTTKPQVMIDLETMSTRPYAAICSIGAVKFGSSGTIIDTFYRKIDLTSCKEVGLHIDKDTVEWWKNQNREALMELVKDTKPLKEVLAEFSDWFGPKSLEVWGNGSDFDNVILDHAYWACGMQKPWKFRDNRCFRTLKALVQVAPPEMEGTAHNALDDALAQVRHWVLIMNS